MNGKGNEKKKAKSVTRIERERARERYLVSGNVYVDNYKLALY